MTFPVEEEVEEVEYGVQGTRLSRRVPEVTSNNDRFQRWVASPRADDDDDDDADNETSETEEAEEDEDEDKEDDSSPSSFVSPSTPVFLRGWVEPRTSANTCESLVHAGYSRIRPVRW